MKSLNLVSPTDFSENVSIRVTRTSKEPVCDSRDGISPVEPLTAGSTLSKTIGTETGKAGWLN